MFINYLSEQIISPDEKFKPYIEALPKNINDFPIMFTDNELKYLKGTNTLILVDNKRKIWEDIH